MDLNNEYAPQPPNSPQNPSARPKIMVPKLEMTLDDFVNCSTVHFELTNQEPIEESFPTEVKTARPNKVPFSPRIIYHTPRNELDKLYHVPSLNSIQNRYKNMERQFKIYQMHHDRKMKQAKIQQEKIFKQEDRAFKNRKKLPSPTQHIDRLPKDFHTLEKIIYERREQLQKEQEKKSNPRNKRFQYNLLSSRKLPPETKAYF